MKIDKIIFRTGKQILRENKWDERKRKLGLFSEQEKQRTRMEKYYEEGRHDYLQKETHSSRQSFFE